MKKQLKQQPDEGGLSMPQKEKKNKKVITQPSLGPVQSRSFKKTLKGTAYDSPVLSKNRQQTDQDEGCAPSSGSGGSIKRWNDNLREGSGEDDSDEAREKYMKSSKIRQSGFDETDSICDDLDDDFTDLGSQMMPPKATNTTATDATTTPSHK